MEQGKSEEQEDNSDVDSVAESVKLMAVPGDNPSQRQDQEEEELVQTMPLLGVLSPRIPHQEREEELVQTMPLLGVLSPRIPHQDSEEELVQMMPRWGRVQRLPQEDDDLMPMMPQWGIMQRQESESAEEARQMQWLQPKLVVGQSRDKYEQEADSVAAQVMSMSAPPTILEPIQRQTEEQESLLQKSPLADSITPLIQRQTEEQEEQIQAKSLPQRASATSKNDAGNSLENKLTSSKGGGSPLPDDVRSFMEPRFGNDFSQVRVHTDSTAVQMNKELRARAFTHGSNIYYGAGKSAAKDSLTAHELSHVVQQTGAKTLQTKPITNLRSHKETLQAKINSTPKPTLQPKEHPQQQTLSNKDKINKDDTQTADIQPKCAACVQEEPVQTIQPKENRQQQKLSNKDELLKDNTHMPNIQPKCASCTEEEQVQRQPLVRNTIPQAEGDTTVQAFGWEDIENTASAGANWVGDKASAGANWVSDKASQAASLGKEAFASLVARVAPGLANLIRSGSMGLLTEKIKEGIKGWLSGMIANVDVGSAIANLKNNFAGVFETIKGLGKGDPASCAAFAQSIKSLQDMGQAFMDSPAIGQLQAAFTQVNSIFKKVSDLVIAPAFDTLINVAGSVFNAVKGLATTIWEWGAPVRNTLGAAWDWVKQQLGFGGDGESGILNWLKTKASDAWTQIKEPLAPAIEPLKTVGTVLLAFSPVGQVALIIKFVPQLVQSVQWLWAHKDDPNIVKSAHEQMGKTILPGLLSAMQGFSNAMQSTVTGLVSRAVQLSEAVLGLLGAITGMPLLNMAQNLVQTVSNGVKALVVWGQEAFQSASQSVSELVAKIQAKIAPYAGVLSSLGLAIVNPAMIPVILASSAWRMLDDCYKAPIINFLLDTVISLLKAAPSLPMFGLLWPMLKAGVIGFLQGMKGKPDSEKVAITNKLAKIISGGSPAFILGFVKGLLKGIWEGLTDPFVLIYEAIQGLGNLVTWLNDVANQALSSTPTGEKPASPATAANKNVEMGQRMQQMAGELEPPVQQVSQGFMPAVQEVFSSGGDMSFEQLMQKLGDAWAGVETAIRNAGGTLADKVCQFMLQDSAEGEMGESVGWLAGTIAFEVVLGILTAGSWTAAKGAMKGLKLFAKVLDWTGEAMGLAFKGLAKVGGFILDGIKGLGKLLSNAGGAARAILDALGEIGQKLISFADELLGRAAKGAAGEVVEEGAEKAAKEAVETGAEKATKEAVETSAEKGAKEGVEEGAEKGAKETSDNAAKKAAELPAAIAQAKGITEANDAVDTPVPTLIGVLNASIQSKYPWIKRFEARPKATPGHYSIHMMASDHEIDPDYTTTRKSKKREPITDPRIISELPLGEVRTPEELEKARQYFKNRKQEARRRWEERTGEKWPIDPATGQPARASHRRPLADGGDPMVVEPAYGDANTEHMIPGATGETDQQRFGRREGTKPRGGKREPITNPRIISELPPGEVRTPEELEKARQYFKNRKQEARRRWEERTGEKWPIDPATGQPARASHRRPLADGGDPMVVEPAYGDANTEHMIPGATGETDQQRFGRRRKNQGE
ncbi:MAG: hypothetical protein Fur006_05670 [Coleofasciculaceae cyanobacterium]